MKETELASHIVEYFVSLGYEVYQEVTVKRVGIIDIVAKKDDTILAVECKTSANITVLFQANKNRTCANYSYIAVPLVKQRFRKFILEIAELMGIGVLEHYYLGVKETMKPKSLTPSIPIMLLDKQKNFAMAGNNNGKRWTPFMDTVHNLVAFVEKNNGCDIKHAVSSIAHHYKSQNVAILSIKKRITQGIIKLNISDNKLYIP